MIMTYQQASRAVNTACVAIANSDLKIEGKLLSFDNFESELVWWFYAELIEKEWIDYLQKQVREFKRNWKIMERRK